MNINGLEYALRFGRPHGHARLGLALSWWHTNKEDLLFQLRRMARWPGRELFAVSCCSHANLSREEQAEAEGLCEFVVHCGRDLGHQDGTTAHCNGAIAPLWDLCPHASVVAHTDADTPLLSPAHLFGWASLLEHSGKVILTSTNSFVWQDGKLVGHPELGPGSVTDRQFGATFFLNRERLRRTAYFPFPLRGNFETDRFTHFLDCGLDPAADAVILPRVESLKQGELRNMDFSLGVMHSTNARSAGEAEDRKVRMLRVLGEPG